MDMAAVSLYDPAVLFFIIISSSFSFINCFIKVFICFMYALFKKESMVFLSTLSSTYAISILSSCRLTAHTYVQSL